MATLQKFKLLATQCAVAGSPSRSPTASPVIHLRRRKTLRMLLSRPERRRVPRRGTSSEIRDIDGDGGNGDDDDQPEKRKEVRVRHKLKDLFVSSPPPLDDKRGQEDEERGLLPASGSVVVGSGRFGGGGGGFSNRRGGGIGSLRPVTAAFRYRFLRRAWRPVLVTIPE
ncbi:hypothetical protein FNV43_RR13980 [Rhamnella rubrinervis]|uniref:Uncharacterized protein n=1 Tax=Rhamnella rubrinervis TaxID=2594499 RepID=A0A8K0MFV7_9ROSA|nr:hypothetical protein FNV43_RR13980 [Rhamnella rubrinervis]